MTILLLLAVVSASAHEPPAIPGVSCKDEDGTPNEWPDHLDCAKQIQTQANQGAAMYNAILAASSVGAANGDKTSQQIQAMLPGVAKSMSDMYAPAVDEFFDHLQAQSAKPQDTTNAAQYTRELTANISAKQQIKSIHTDLDVIRQQIAQTGATVLCQAGDCRTAALMAQWWANNQPGDPNAQVALSKDQLALHNYPAAASAANAALALNPELEQALALRGAAELGLGDAKDAAADGSRALALNPSDKLASDVYQTARATDSGSVAKAFDPSKILSLMWTKKDNAVAVGVGGEAVNPGELVVGAEKTGAGQAWADQAANKFQLGDYNAVIQICDGVLAVDPNNVDALLMRANAKNMIGDYKGALADSTKALSIRPSADAYDARAWALNHMGRADEALKDANAALQLNPSDAVAMLNRANANESLGHPKEALADYKKAADLNPAFKSAWTSAYARLSGAAEGGPSGMGGLLGAHKGAGLGLLGLLAAAGLGALALKAKPAPGTTTGIRRALGSTTGSGSKFRTGALADEEDEDLAPGQVLGGKYAVEAELGRGGMGVVYKGKDTVLERPIAIKKMRGELSSSATEKERFLQEARMVAALHHPGIVAIHDIFEEGGDLFLVFELVEGQPLDRLIEEHHGLSLEQCKKILRPVCEALDYAHTKKIVHRDLKPSNIVVSPDGGVKVMDFGIARQAKDTIARMSATDGIGTPAYMPPEQERGHVCKESDVYALGATLYEMATGRPPFRTGNFTLQKMEMGYTQPSRIKTELGVQFDSVISKALQPEPEKRYHSAKDLFRALESVPDGAATA